MCTEMAVRWGDRADHETYLHREGFYRGSAVAFLVVAVSVGLRKVVPGPATVPLEGTVPLTKDTLLFLLVGALAASFLSFLRYRRFSAHLLKWSVLTFLALARDRRTHPPAQKDPSEAVI
jgi:hypothetical protein